MAQVGKAQGLGDHHRSGELSPLWCLKEVRLLSHMTKVEGDLVRLVVAGRWCG